MALIVTGNTIVNNDGNLAVPGSRSNLNGILNVYSGNSNVVVSGNVNFSGNISGNGIALSYITGGNVIGTVSSATTAGTVTTNAQPNITSVGILSGLSVSGNASVGNIAATLVTGTLATAAQPNVTSLGTLSSLGVSGSVSTGALTVTGAVGASGTITAPAFTANTGVFTGNAAGLFSINGANVSLVPTATSAGTVTTNAQPNITSVGTLTNLSVSGNTSSGNVSGIIRPTAGAAVAGIIFPDNPGGGGLDAASIKYYPYSGEDCVLEVAVTNDPADYIFLNAAGGTRIAGTLTTTAITTGANTTPGVITGSWTLSAGSRLQSTYADLGERYTSDSNYAPGTVLMIGGQQETTIATQEGKYRLAGIVSTNPAYVLNSMEENSVILALAGRVPCKVVGKINKGDLLTISDIPGVATSTQPPASGMIIGRALEDYDSQEVGTIEVKVDSA